MQNGEKGNGPVLADRPRGEPLAWIPIASDEFVGTETEWGLITKGISKFGCFLTDQDTVVTQDLNSGNLIPMMWNCTEAEFAALEHVLTIEMEFEDQ